MSEDVRIRRLGVDDLSDLVALASRLNWNDEERRYSLLLEVSDVYGLEDPDGAGLIGTVTLTRFEPAFATVGMMLVDPAHGGRGHGRTLMRHALGVAGDATVALFATAAGRPLYEKVGFVTLGLNHSHRGRYTGDPTGMSEGATDTDLDEIIELDRAVTGCDRGALLGAYVPFAERVRIARRDDSSVSGYAGLWRHGELGVIGPVVAASTDEAIVLAGDLAADAGSEVRIEVGEDRAELAVWADATGLKRAATTSLMTLDGRPLPGDRDRWFMPLTLALG
jgi:GNAT superfamily N-acetyltransferase